ncbi:hypothetical protein J6590_075855 [Homalodisca vitripennis]|nr:hypothetical protein J6590_075855 [Homalodisca vitripennis]
MDKFYFCLFLPVCIILGNDLKYRLEVLLDASLLYKQYRVQSREFVIWMKWFLGRLLHPSTDTYNKQGYIPWPVSCRIVVSREFYIPLPIPTINKDISLGLGLLHPSTDTYNKQGYIPWPVSCRIVVSRRLLHPSTDTYNKQGYIPWPGDFYIPLPIPTINKDISLACVMQDMWFLGRLLHPSTDTYNKQGYIPWPGDFYIPLPIPTINKDISLGLCHPISRVLELLCQTLNHDSLEEKPSTLVTICAN